MHEFFKDWGASFKVYWAEMKEAPAAFWLLLPAMLLGIWTLTILLRFATGRGKYPFKTIYTIHRRIAIASGILGTIWVFWMIYCWSSQYYETHPVHLIHLFCFLLLLVIPLLSLIVLRGYYKREKLRDIAEHPKTGFQEEKIVDRAKKGFYRTKLWGLLIVAGFTGLLFWGLREEKNLVSIVLDNSSSMEDAIRNGKIALGNTFRHLNPGTNIVLTSFTPQQVLPLKTYEEILNFKKFNTVSANNFFESPDAAQDALNAISVENSVGSPIAQCIWENYEFVKQSCPVKDYKNIILLIVTDGVDNLSESLAQSGTFFCNNAEFSELYPPENVHIIDVKDNFENGNVNNDPSTGYVGPIRLFEKASKCGYDIESGKALEDYTQATEDALKDFRKDWWLMFDVAGLYVLYLLLLLFITLPSRP